MTSQPRDLGASSQARLRNLAMERGDDVQLVLTQFVLERLLHRLGASDHREQFVLKGAMLFLAWSDLPHRPTRDLDLLGHGPADEDRLIQMFREICATPVEDDGVRFETAGMSIASIREDQAYEGLRLQFVAAVGTARLNVQVDIGFGDDAHPLPTVLELPTLLSHPAPNLLAYARETAIAEKVEAMISLGLLNSRMKDFFDVHFLSTRHSFDLAMLSESLRRTFERRGTALPATSPVALTDEFALDKSKQTQWRAFSRRTKLATELSLAEIVRQLRSFLGPALATARHTRSENSSTWTPPGPWQPE